MDLRHSSHSPAPSGRYRLRWAYPAGDPRPLPLATPYPMRHALLNTASHDTGRSESKKTRGIEGGRRAFRLHTYVIPVTRLCGLAAVTALIAVHNLAVLGDMNWPSLWTFLYVATFYGLGSWLTLRFFFLESRKLDLGTLFLVADVPVLLFAIHLTGGTSSWLFLLLAARCTDQIFFGIRRVIW